MSKLITYDQTLRVKALELAAHHITQGKGRAADIMPLAEKFYGFLAIDVFEEMRNAPRVNFVRPRDSSAVDEPRYSEGVAGYRDGG